LKAIKPIKAQISVSKILLSKQELTESSPLINVYLNGHTSGSHTEKFEPPQFCSIINSTTEIFYSVAFIWMVTLKDFIHSLKGSNHLVQHCKQQHRSIAHYLSFEWFHFRNSFTDSKFRTTSRNVINSTTGKHCSVAFIWMVTL